MEKISGRWTGEYTVNSGTEEEPNISYFHFKTKINESDSVISGNFIDLTLETKESELQGFVENDFISFIRTSEQSPELLEFLQIEFDSPDKTLEFTFSGNYDLEENAYVGIWELHLEEEQDGLQEAFFDHSILGEWYMRKMV